MGSDHLGTSLEVGDIGFEDPEHAFFHEYNSGTVPLLHQSLPAMWKRTYNKCKQQRPWILQCLWVLQQKTRDEMAAIHGLWHSTCPGKGADSSLCVARACGSGEILNLWGFVLQTRHRQINSADKSGHELAEGSRRQRVSFFVPFIPFLVVSCFPPTFLVIARAGAMLVRRSSAAQALLEAWAAERAAGNQELDQDALNQASCA